MVRKQLTVTRTLPGGRRIRYKTPDKGALGRTPKRKRWAKFEMETGWRKTMTADKRRRLVLDAHKHDYLASGRAMQQLANVTTDARTELLAGRDARYFFTEHKRLKGRSKRK